MFYVICMPFFKSRYFFKIWFFFSVFNYSASKYAIGDSVRGRFRKWLLFFIFIFFIGKSIVPFLSPMFISCFETFLDVESRDKHVKRSRYKNGWLVKVDPKQQTELGHPDSAMSLASARPFTLASLKKVTCDVGRNEIYISRYLDREPLRDWKSHLVTFIKTRVALRDVGRPPRRVMKSCRSDCVMCMRAHASMCVPATNPPSPVMTKE